MRASSASPWSRGAVGKTDRRRRPALSVPQILGWADAYHRRRGVWPTVASGTIAGALGLTWHALDKALRYGYRDLPGGTSLARLLTERRGVRNPANLPHFTQEHILAWADAHFRRCQAWPTEESGPIPEAPGETWKAVGFALRQGRRGLTGGTSLAQLLAKARGTRNRARLPDLTRAQVLAWADAYHGRTGRWPGSKSGPIREAPGETWAGMDWALSRGARGLPGGSSLAQLFAEARGVRNRKRLPPFTLEQIRAWAEAHYRRTAAWPTARSGPIPEAPGETWMAVVVALQQGRRGLPGGSSLTRLLQLHRPTSEMAWVTV